MRTSLPFAAITAALLALAPAAEALADRDDDHRGRPQHGSERGRDRDHDHSRDHHDRGRGRDDNRHDHYRPAPPPPPRVVHHHHHHRPPPPPPVVHYHVVQPQQWHGHYGRRWHRLPEFYSLNVGIDRGQCDRRTVGSNVGTLLGAVAGGLAGSTIGDGRGQVAATLGGVLVGAAIGSSLSGGYDGADYGCAVQTFERAPTGQPVVWDNPDAGARYTLIPTRTYEASSGRYCREYTSRAEIGGRAQSVHGTACRQPDGSWEIVG